MFDSNKHFNGSTSVLFFADFYIYTNVQEILQYFIGHWVAKYTFLLRVSRIKLQIAFIIVLQNNYSLPKTSFNIQASIIPEGDYHVVANISMNGAEVVCLDIYVSIA